MKLAAFTIPLGAMRGWAKSPADTERPARENSSLNIRTPPYSIRISLSHYRVTENGKVSRKYFSSSYPYRGADARVCGVETRLDALLLGISLAFKTGIETNLDAAA